MKLYTEKQVRESFSLGFKLAIETDGGLKEFKEEFINSLTPIELPSDDDIEKQSINIAHNYFDMYNTNHYQGLKDGSYKMAKWMKEQILNKNK